MNQETIAKKGFTLIELLIAVGIVSILATTVAIVINPAELSSQARDGERLNDLNSVNSAISFAQALGQNINALTSPQVIYISLPDPTAATSTCPTYSASLPALPGGWSYQCVNEANLQKVDGTGWIPINFTALQTTNPLATLPIDPLNVVTNDQYYTFTSSSWELTANLESQKFATLEANDGGYSDDRYEFGSDVALLAQTPFGGGTPPPPPPSNGSSWALATANAGWSARSYFGSTTNDNKIWVMGGGQAGSNNKNDVWYSTDGVSWTQATSSAQWTARSYHAVVNYNNRIWVIGGGDNLVYKNDVWYSTDGIGWTQATSSAQWTGRSGHASVIHNNKMWLTGGWEYPSYALKNDVWYSTDGVSWTQATSSAQWGTRGGHTSLSYDNKIWIIGGYDGTNRKRDVWYSTDGVSWTQATASAQWVARSGHTSLVYDNKMWVIGGYDDSNYRNDVWYSTNGASWIQATSSAQWAGRVTHTSVVHNYKMWVMGGVYTGPTYKNDVWYTQ